MQAEGEGRAALSWAGKLEHNHSYAHPTSPTSSAAKHPGGLEEEEEEEGQSCPQSPRCDSGAGRAPRAALQSHHAFCPAELKEMAAKELGVFRVRPRGVQSRKFHKVIIFCSDVMGGVKQTITAREGESLSGPAGPRSVPKLPSPPDAMWMSHQGHATKLPLKNTKWRQSGLCADGRREVRAHSWGCAQHPGSKGLLAAPRIRGAPIDALI